MDNNTYYLFLDTETTGLSPEKGDKIVELAYQLWHGDTMVLQFSSLVNPCRNIPQEVTAINGITDAMVANAPVFATMAPLLRAVMAKADYLIGHNISFDEGFLCNELKIAGLVSNIPAATFCTKTQAKAHGGFENNRLGTVAKALGISTVGAHRALADVDTCRQVYIKLGGK
jgi:DNA polymerase III epsilon subunit family exonuclease